MVQVVSVSGISSETVCIGQPLIQRKIIWLQCSKLVFTKFFAVVALIVNVAVFNVVTFSENFIRFSRTATARSATSTFSTHLTRQTFFGNVLLPVTSV